MSRPGTGIGSTAYALARASQPLPTVVVTGFGVLLAAVAGNGAGRCMLLAAAVFTGQLTVGWFNDLLDAPADAAVGRRSKPLAAGELSPRLVAWCLFAAVLATAALSLAAGWRPGGAYLFAVGCGWLYNLWLKGTRLSWLPYSLAFAALTAMATLALRPPRWPAGWAIAAALLLGVAGNLTNTLPGLAGRHPAGFRGLPDRIGARRSLVAAGGLLVLGTGCLAFGPAGEPDWLRWAGLAVQLLLAGLGIRLLRRRAETRAPFYALVAALVVPAAMLVAAGQLTG